ncbi:carbohydrate kinase family protein [Streptomyces sp. NK08204]|uniref:carbohydrate kinase family protein n=1 Tax=Streptomyces sp. NK08204 TaxID=2873260 RepID=UPI001CED11CE|nr:carbohydrate kinase family protein [Streptomyces sp. NK08204]
MTGSDVIVIGFNTMDLVFTGREALRPDHKVYADSLTQHAGGQGSNVAVDLAGLGLAVHYLGMFGDDAWGEQVRASMTDAGISVEGSVTVPDCPNHVAVVAVATTSGTRSIVMCKDPRLTAGADLVPADALRRTRAFYTDGHEFEASVAAAELARSLGVRVFADLEVAREDAARLLAHVDELAAPLEVIRTLAGTDDEAKALAYVRALGPAVVVATKGAEGCAGLDEQGRHFTVAAFPAEVADSTGAGDAFHAGFLAARLRGADVREAAAWGNRAGAVKCGHPGPRVPLAAMARLREEMEGPAA